MRFATATTAFLAIGAAVASPVASGQDGQIVQRGEETSFGDASSELKSIKEQVSKDFSNNQTPEVSEVNDVTDRILRLVQGLVPVNLDLLTEGDLLNLLDILNNLDGIFGTFTQGLGAGDIQSRQLSYSPLIDVLYPLLTTTSELVGGILSGVYGIGGSNIAKQDPEIQKKLVASTTGLSGDLGGLFDVLGGLGDLLPIGN